MENLIKAILVLLGPILFAATEVAAQYASPYLGNTILSWNPAVNVWKEDSSITIYYTNSIEEKMSPNKKERVQVNYKECHIAYISETFGFRTTLELGEFIS